MALTQLPPSLQQCLLLEWLSPDTVFALVRASSVLRRFVVTSTTPTTFRAADEEIVSDACIRWFREHRVPLRLWESVVTDRFTTIYRLNGKVHRDGDLPAWITANGMQVWFQHGKHHRDDLPAIIYAGGTQVWYQHDKQHRDEDLPAVIQSDGTQIWSKHGMLHRDGDLPAYIGADGVRGWYQHDKQHRDGDLPAVVMADGGQVWYKNGKRHRDGDLPAYIGANGRQEWWFHGVKQ